MQLVYTLAAHNAACIMQRYILTRFNFTISLALSLCIIIAGGQLARAPRHQSKRRVYSNHHCISLRIVCRIACCLLSRRKSDCAAENLSGKEARPAHILFLRWKLKRSLSDEAVHMADCAGTFRATMQTANPAASMVR